MQTFLPLTGRVCLSHAHGYGQSQHVLYLECLVAQAHSSVYTHPQISQKVGSEEGSLEEGVNPFDHSQNLAHSRSL